MQTEFPFFLEEETNEQSHDILYAREEERKGSLLKKSFSEKEVDIMLKIEDSFVFRDDWSCRRSSLMYFEGDEEESASWSGQIGFAAGDFQGEEILPALCINPIDTDKGFQAELVGETFSVASIEESCEGEYSFCIYEHEPLVSYELKLLELREDQAHVK